ncbi:MAG TPA: transketolase [Thermoanaerobaculia bacterium]|nr:transketolase [Thermoanaerobaculia bacterium]
MTEIAAAQSLDRIGIDTLRFLAVDMVEAAQSGHPGAPLGQAPMAWALWSRLLRFDPDDPGWPDRDRFVLSAGHASALLYGLLHLAGFDLPLEELRRFRQLESKTPGHPENFLTAGVETTTGPLGQGLGNAVGMAMAREMAAATFNRDGFPLFTHRVWVIASDGDMMEGVASEASSLAGHLRLGCLNVLYDDNRITIDGPTELAFSEDVVARYAAYGWHVQSVEDGNDLGALDAAMRAAAAESGRPSLIRVRTHIGYGSPGKQDTADAHGAPLGSDEAAATKRALGWPEEPPFLVPEEARQGLAAARRRGAEARRGWQQARERYAQEHPQAAAELARRLDGRLAEGWRERLPRFEEGKAMATRAASGKVLNALAPALPELVGGSADLTESNQTLIADSGDFSAAERAGRNLRFGVREHAMGSALNGIALSRLFRPYGGTFLIFSDYMRPAIRLAALMRLPVIYVFTHDSVFLGEDGPTHQPVSQLAGLRAVPHLAVLRPADANETTAAWAVALERRDGPTALALTRQKVPTLAATAERAAEGVPRGGYVLADWQGGEDLVLLATGSEVQLVMEARERLQREGVGTRVVSLPSWELFAAQPQEYRDSVLPPRAPRRLAVEAAAALGWHRWVGAQGEVLALDGFGASAPWQEVARHLGFTADEVVRRARSLLGLPAPPDP